LPSGRTPLIQKGGLRKQKGEGDQMQRIGGEKEEGGGVS